MADERPEIGSRFRRIVRKTLRVLGIVVAVYVLVVALAVWIAGDGDYEGRVHDTVVNDITELNPVPMAHVVTPRSVDDIVSAIQAGSGPISIGGGRFSMGGQTASPG